MLGAKRSAFVEITRKGCFLSIFPIDLLVCFYCAIFGNFNNPRLFCVSAFKKFFATTSMNKRKICKVLIADDHAVVRRGIKFVLMELDPKMEVILVDDFPEAISKVKEQSFDLLILDINIPGGNNIGMMDSVRVHHPNLPILIFTSYSESVYGLAYLQAGANGFLSKDAPEKELQKALECIESGRKYFSSSLQEAMLNSLINKGSLDLDPLSKLSKREMDVADLLIKGHSTAEIGNILNLQLSTISTFKARIFAKMNVSNLVELMAKMKVGI